MAGTTLVERCRASSSSSTARAGGAQVAERLATALVPRNWMEFVNEPQSEAELNALPRCVRRGSPFGSADWTGKTAKQLGIESLLRPRGRPKKEGKTANNRQLSLVSYLPQIWWVAPFVLLQVVNEIQVE